VFHYGRDRSKSGRSRGMVWHSDRPVLSAYAQRL